MSWLRKLFGFYICERDNRLKYSIDEPCSQAMIDIIVGEIRAAYTAVVSSEYDVQRSCLSLQTGGADYSWLMDHRQMLQLPEVKRMEIEELCHQLRPEECNRLLVIFRSKTGQCKYGHEVLKLFKEIAELIMKERPRPATVSDWFSFHVNPINKVSTVCDEINGYQFHRSLHDDFSRPSTSSVSGTSSCSTTNISSDVCIGDIP